MAVSSPFAHCRDEAGDGMKLVLTVLCASVLAVPALAQNCIRNPLGGYTCDNGVSSSRPNPLGGSDYSNGVSSRPNPTGGMDYSNGVTSRPNPLGGMDYSNGVTCRPNPLGGMDCR